MARTGRERNTEGFFVRLVRTSLFLGALDRFSLRFFSALKNGLFGWIFTGYDGDAGSRVLPWISRGKTGAHLRELRFGICRRIETSAILNLFRKLLRMLLGCRLKVFGICMLSFAASASMTELIVKTWFPSLKGSGIDHQLIYGLILAGVATIPLILSRRTVSGALAVSVVGRAVMKLFCFREEDLCPEGSGGWMNAAFIVGAVCGVLTCAVRPLYFLLVPVLLLSAVMVLVKPEIGVLGLFVMTPWIGTKTLAVLVIYTFLCFAVKLLRQKRMFRLEAVDIAAAGFAVLLFGSGVISCSGDSKNQALMRVCLMGGYFLTVLLIRNREWLVRCAAGSVLSAAAISVYGILQYYRGAGYSSSAWLDSEMFSVIEKRATATLKNPNMLGVYLILIIPVAVSMLVGHREGLGRFLSFLSVGAAGICLILTWSRGAWIGLFAAALLFLFLWDRRAVWLIPAGIAGFLIALPFLGNSTILYRITSIGNLADSSTSYRVYIWRSSVRMIRDYWLTGIGFGEGAYTKVYPMYAFQGIEAAPHSHNLFMQIWIEMGVVGFAVFILFLFLLFQAAFTLFRNLSGPRLLKNPDISSAVLRANLQEGRQSRMNDMRWGKYQIRISAAGPLCGLFAVLVQGMTDYVWYNFEVYLMFWLIAGLAACYIRNGREQLESGGEQIRCVCADGSLSAEKVERTDPEECPDPEEAKGKENRGPESPDQHETEDVQT